MAGRHRCPLVFAQSQRFKAGIEFIGHALNEFRAFSGMMLSSIFSRRDRAQFRQSRQIMACF